MPTGREDSWRLGKREMKRIEMDKKPCPLFVGEIEKLKHVFG
jgi:hypothetical protein